MECDDEIVAGEVKDFATPKEGKDPLVRLEWGKKKAGLNNGEPFEMWRLEGV